MSARWKTLGVLSLILCASILTFAWAQKPTLLIANWQGYGTDIPWVVEAFEKQCNCNVKQVDINSEDGLINLLRQGGVGKIDVALPNLPYVPIAIQEGLVQPIDTSKLSNYKNLIPRLRDLPELTSNGKVYAVPWQWGTEAIGYNPTLVSEPVTSYAALWDKQYAGKITFNDDPVVAVLTAAIYLGEDPYHPDLAKVKEALLEQKRLDNTYWATTDDFTKLFVTKQIALGNVWFGLANQIKANGYDMVYVTPKNAITQVDTWMLVKNAPHPKLAYEWIDFMISQEFQARYARDLAAQPPSPTNQIVQDNLPTNLKQSVQSEAVLEKAIPQDQLRAWTNLWAEVKATPVEPLK